MMRSLNRSREMCEWDEFAKAAPRIRELLAQGRSDRLSPFHLLSTPGVTAREQRACSELWTRDRLAARRDERHNLAFRFELTERQRLRVGYLSNDFHDHATSLLLIETLEAHDRERFEIHAFSFGADDGKSMRPRIRNAFHVFHDISALSDIVAAQAIHRERIDILIDLKGYTQGARTNIMMLHPAPVQVNFLGYPGTLGANICDYIVTDLFMTPPGSEADYSEAFAYMPNSYQPRGRQGAIGEKPTRSQVGLPETGFVFCCFNQAHKLTPSVFDLWCRLLEATPNSVLWLLRAERAESNLREEARRRGVAGNRLIFAPDMAQENHLGRLQIADLVLDTTPYGAHTTASDALWAGTPIVTCAGETFPARVAASLLRAVGLPKLIADSEDNYFELALSIASEPAKLATLKEKLLRDRLTVPLFDVASYTRALESLYEIMWRRRCAGGPRANIQAFEA
jgi:predicted O-linked N-acetylglucosamine transferase (SPINDLY family)